MEEQVEYAEHQEKHHVVADFKHEKSPREKRLLLKQDLAIVPLLAGCFFFAYLVPRCHCFSIYVLTK